MGGSISGMRVSGMLDEDLGLGLVDQKPCQVWVRWPFTVFLAEGQYLEAYV